MMCFRAAVMVAFLVACGGKQPGPPAGDGADAAVALDVRPRPAVPPLDRSADIGELRERLAATADPREHLILLGLIVEAEWDASCPAEIDGLCYQPVARAVSSVATCDSHTHEVVMIARAEQRVVEAIELIGEVRKRWGEVDVMNAVSEPPTDDELAAYAQNTYIAEEVGASLLIVGHLETEALFAIPRPAGLDLSSPAKDASLDRAAVWRETVRQRTREAVAQYSLVVDDPVLQALAPAYVVEALARIGTVQMWMPRQLYGVDMPNGILGNPDMEQAFCEAMKNELAQYERLAEDAFTRCVKLASDTGETGPWADRCHDELARLRPSP